MVQFDPSLEFLNQMTSFGFLMDFEFIGATAGTKKQNFYNAEAELVAPAYSQLLFLDPLPLLGLLPFAWYFRKLKKINKFLDKLKIYMLERKFLFVGRTFLLAFFIINIPNFYPLSFDDTFILDTYIYNNI